MIMEFKQFKRIATTLYNNKVKREKYLSKYPSNYREMIITEQYVESFIWESTFLFNEVFGEHYTHHGECLEWFLYEWKPGYSIVDDGVETVINSFDEYLNYKESTWI